MFAFFNFLIFLCVASEDNLPHFLRHSGEKLLHEEIFCVLGSERVLVLVEGGG